MNSLTSLEVQRQHALEANRMYRAAEIVDRNQIRLLPSGNYQVASQSDEGKVYMVNPVYEECNCVDCRVNGNVCKHFIAYLLLDAQQKAEPKTYDDYLKPRRDVAVYRQIAQGYREDIIAQREIEAKAAKPKRTEWVEEAYL